MKAVILAAGEGTRMWPLTEDTPKPLLPVAGKPILQHTVEEIEGHVEEIFIVAGYRIEDIKEFFSGREDIEIVKQQEALGTADAALKAREKLDGRTLILNGDDIYSLDWNMIGEVENGIITSRVEKPSNYGVIDEENGLFKGIDEKPENPSGNRVNIGCYIVQEEFFQYLEDVEKSHRGEYEITDALQQYSSNFEIELLGAEGWIPCSYPWQLLEANSQLLEENEREISGEVAESAVIKGDVTVEEGATIKENTVVEGPAIIKSGSTVGPNAYVREGTVLHRNVKVGTSEIKNTVVCEGSNIPHFNYVGDSYLSSGVNLGAGTKVANLRNDGEEVKIKLKGEYLETGSRKIGAFIGSNTRTGVNCSINPGTLVGMEVVTDSGEKLSGTVESGSVVKEE